GETYRNLGWGGAKADINSQRSDRPPPPRKAKVLSDGGRGGSRGWPEVADSEGMTRCVGTLGRDAQATIRTAHLAGRPSHHQDVLKVRKCAGRSACSQDEARKARATKAYFSYAAGERDRSATKYCGQ